MGGMLLSGGDGDMNFLTASRERTSTRSRLLILRRPFRFLRERRVILIENSGFSKNAMNLREYLALPAASTYFVFVEEEVDKRSKMYKAVKNAGKIVEFATQTEELITR